MKAWLQRLLSPPRFADPDQDRIGRSTYTCAVVFMGIVSLWMPAAMSFQDDHGRIAAVGFGALAVLGAAASFARAGWARGAAAMLVGLMFFVASFGVWSEGGIRGTSQGTFLAAVLAASLFFSLRVAWATAASVVVVMLGFWQLEMHGHLPPAASIGGERVLVSTFTTMAVVLVLVQLNFGRIRDSQRFLREFTAAAPDALYVFDLDERRIVHGNDASRMQLGYEIAPGEDTVAFRRVLHPDDIPKLAEHGARLAAAADDEIVEFEYRAKHRDGTWRTVRDRARVFDRTADGRVRQIVGAAVDVTAEREAQLALELNRERMRRGERLEALGQLAGGIAHDFNNYLTVIIGATDAITSDPAADASLRELAGEANAAAHRSAELTRQLLGFSRHRLIQPRIFDLNELLDESDRLLRRVIPENIELELRPGEGPQAIYADRSQIEQAVLNLVVNARDAMPEGGRIVIETCTVEPSPGKPGEAPDLGSGEFVVLSVSDSGIGIDDDTRARIFEPLFTTKEAGAGTGFGLATVEAVVGRSGGFVRVESEPGVGTRFELFLPRADGEAVEAMIPVPVEEERGTERVLLVEDDASVRKFTRRALERSGYRVTDAFDGAEGRRVFLESPEAFDVLLTDVMLPNVSGFDLAAEVRSVRPGFPIVFMSGYTASELTREGLGPGDFLVHKPFGIAELLGRLREAIVRS